MAKTKCLLLLHELSLTGAPKVALDVFGAISYALTTTILCLRPGPLEDTARSIGTLLWAPDPGSHGASGKATQAARLARLLPELVHLVRSPPDVIYVNSVAALFMARRLPLPHVPILLHVHELEVAFQLLGADRPERIQRADRFIAVSKPVADMLTDRYGIDEERIALVHECIPDALLQGGRHKDRAREARFVVGGVGHPQWRKGVESWLRMARALLDVLGPSRVRFVWVGVRDDADGVIFRAMVHKLGLSDAVEVVTVVSDPMHYYDIFDVLAMTSWEDPCPLVVLEAMSRGIPVFCFEGGGGAPEVIGDRRLVVPDFSPAAMAEAIRKLLDAPEERQATGARLRERVRAEFTVSVQAPKILAAIHRTISDR